MTARRKEKVGETTATPTVGNRPDDNLENAVAAMEEMYQHGDPFTIAWVVTDLQKIVVESCRELKLDMRPEAEAGKIIRAILLMIDLFRSRLRNDLLALATTAWQQSKPLVEGPEAIYAHGLLSAIFSTTYATREGITSLESWATSSQVTLNAFGRTLQMHPERRQAFFLKAADSIPQAKRLGSVLRAVAIASNDQLIALLEIVKPHPRHIVPPF